MTIWAEPLPQLAPTPCAACPWPLGAVLCHTREMGDFVLCGHCAEQMQRQTVIAFLLEAALCE